MWRLNQVLLDDQNVYISPLQSQPPIILTTDKTYHPHSTIGKPIYMIYQMWIGKLYISWFKKNVPRFLNVANLPDFHLIWRWHVDIHSITDQKHHIQQTYHKNAVSICFTNNTQYELSLVHLPTIRQYFHQIQPFVYKWQHTKSKR